MADHNAKAFLLESPFMKVLNPFSSLDAKIPTYNITAAASAPAALEAAIVESAFFP